MTPVPVGIGRWSPAPSLLACLVGLAVVGLRAADEAAAPPRPAADTDAVRQCQFIDGTLVPRLVMGVRRVNDGAIDALALRAERDPDGPVIGEAKLFRPYYVVDRRTDPQKEAWLLIQDGYTAKQPLGWVAERHVEPFRSRYAYTFAPARREQPADLHDTSKDGYERLLAQMKGGAKGAEELVVVRERRPEGLAAWNPVTIDDPVPFIELRLPADAIEREYPDTTPTHRFGIPVENRLVHMGAICGGPANLEKLAALRNASKAQAGLEMVFVVDETESMRPFFAGVADFIKSAGKAAAGQGEPVKLAVSYYTDGPPGERVSPALLETVKGEEAAAKLAGDVRAHPDKLPPGDYANPPERMLEGLRDSIAHAGFAPGSDAFVAVVGDTGHEPAEPDEKRKLIAEIAGLVKRHGLHVFFAHVGRRSSENELMFKKDAEEVMKAVVAAGVPPGRVVYQPADANTLAEAIGKAQERAASIRRERRRQMERIASRTPYTEPGPKLLKQLESAGIPRIKFDDLHLQYYVPSRGWLFHPIMPAGGEQGPQYRELFFLAPPEREAVRELFTSLQGRLSKGEPIDHEAAVATLGNKLAAAAGNPGLAAKATAAWNGIPSEQRSLGVFLEDVFGLRLKAALPYPPEDYTKQPATAEEIRTLDERIGRLGRAIADGGPKAVWFEASSLVP